MKWFDYANPTEIFILVYAGLWGIVLSFVVIATILGY
jgi:hypothetical protein